MRSQSLFNFFTKAADVQTTAAGTRVVTGPDADRAKEQTAARANATYEAEQKRRSGMTDQQRWSEDFNNHLSDQAGAGRDQYNFAYDNFTRDLDDAVARGDMTSQQATKARQHIINSVRDQQRAWHSNYLTTYNNGDHTDSDRQGIRGSRIWSTHGDNGLVHFRHGDFSENTTFGGAERGYARRDARNARTTNPPTGNANVTSTSQPAQAASTQTTPQSPNLVRRDRNGRVAPTVFRGGYAVDTGNDVDWSAKGDGHINISGANFTDEQYAAYNNVRSSLTTAIRQQEGVSLNEARARATALANQWAADQSQVAAGGKAFNRWQHVDTPAQEVATPQPAPAAQPVTQPEAVSPAPTGPDTQVPAGQTSSLSVSPGGSIVPNALALNTGNKPITLGGSPDLGISLDALGAVPQIPANNPLANPVTTPTPPTSTEANPAQPATPPAAPTPAEQSTTPAGTTNPTPQQPGNQYKDTVWTQYGIADALNRQKTQIADKLTAIPGYDGLLFRMDGDTEGGVYDRTGRQLTYQGKPINDALLRGDRNGWWELWKDGDYGADILHNAYQAMQSRATSNYGDAEMNALGFTRVPGSRRWYRNAKGQFVDISGELAPTGTIEGQLDHGRTVNQRWRKDTSDPMGLFFDGEREDIGYL